MKRNKFIQNIFSFKEEKAKKDSNFIIKADLVIEAISSSVDQNLTKSLNTDKWGCILVNQNMQTSLEKVFAGGDCISGPSTVVSAMKDGIKAAYYINEYLSK